MFCHNCGNKIIEGEFVCNQCGTRVIAAPTTAPAPTPTAATGSKLKSTFSTATGMGYSPVSSKPIADIENAAPLSGPVNTTINDPADNPIANASEAVPTVEPTPVPAAEPAAYTAPTAAPPAYDGGYTAPTAPSAPYGGYAAPAPVKASKGVGYTRRIILAVLLVASVYLLPVFSTAGLFGGGGFFPDDYMKGWDVLDEIFSNFGDVMEAAFEDASAMGILLLYITPIFVFVAALLNSKAGTFIISLVGTIGALMFLVAMFAWFSDLGAEMGDIMEVIFDFEHTPICVGYWTSLILFIGNTSGALKD